MRELLFDLFAKAVQDFYRREQRNLELDVHEVCHAHRLAIYLEQELRTYDNLNCTCLFYDYSVDLEFNRTEDGDIKKLPDKDENLHNIRCDILVHSKGKNKERENLLLIELKKEDGDDEGKDQERLKMMVSPDPDNSNNPIYNTLLGIFLKISRTGCTGTKYWYENGGAQEKNFEWTHQREW